MNSCGFSGWIPSDPEWRWKNADEQVVQFRLVVRREGVDDEWFSFRCDDQEIISRFRPLLTKGRTIYVTKSEARREAIVKGDIHVRDIVFFQVLELEVPNRSKVDEPASKDEKQPVRQAQGEPAGTASEAAAA